MKLGVVDDEIAYVRRDQYRRLAHLSVELGLGGSRSSFSLNLEYKELTAA